MKKWLILIGVVAILFIGGYFVVSFYAVKFIQARLQKVVGPGLKITEIKINPTYLSAKGILYENPQSKQRFVQIGEMRIYPDLPSFLKGTLRIREWVIFQPSVFFYRSREGVFVGPWVDMEKGKKKRELFDEGGGKEGEPIGLRIDRLRIREGLVHFEDRKTEESPARIELREVDLEIEGIQYPILPSPSSIEFKGKMKGKKKEGSIYTKGWINLKNLDMETSLKVQGVEVKLFEPYYRKRVSAEIESGHIGLEAKITVKRRMIDAPGQLELTDLHIKEGGGTVLWIPAKSLVSLLKHRGNQIKVRFHMKGSIDDPHFNLQETLFTRIAVSLAEALGIPIKVVGETILGGTGKGVEGLVEGLKSIEELFGKKKERKR